MDYPSRETLNQQQKTWFEQLPAAAHVRGLCRECDRVPKSESN
nr:hypothetical protein JVH1_0498 [Rhodococcus sp. JVH1]